MHIKHGRYKTRTYSIWRTMRARCRNPRDINNDGSYEPGNCRWATDIEQGNNRRTNARITLGGRTLTITEWTRERGLPKSIVFNRLQRGWTPERAINTPVASNFQRKARGAAAASHQLR